LKVKRPYISLWLKVEVAILVSIETTNGFIKRLVDVGLATVSNAFHYF